MRDDDRGIAGTADAEGFVHRVENGVGLGAHVGGVDGICADEGFGESENFLGAGGVGRSRRQDRC